jgi:peptidoglycan/xylan/chitin deacetylase (PgdA/CDA1 family)
MKTISITIDTEPDFGGRFGMQWKAIHEKLPEVLDLFDQYGVKATFFVESETLNKISLLKNVQRRGHEIASHGFGHQKITEENIEEQMQKVKEAFAKFGSEPKGFRCPYLIRPQNLFASLLNNGFKYDSSMGQAYFPFRYNYLNVPNHIHDIQVFPETGMSIKEIPVSRMPLSFSVFTVLQSSMRLPSKRFWNKTENAVCYFHFSDIVQWPKETMKQLPWYIQLAMRKSGNNINVLKRMIETFSDREFKKMEEL